MTHRTYQSHQDDGLVFAQMKSLLHTSTPDQDTWMQVCECLEQLLCEDAAYHYASSHLDAWPVTLRYAPRSWLRAKLRGDDPKFWGIIRAVWSYDAVLETSYCRRLLRHVLNEDHIVSFQAQHAHINESEMWMLFDHEAWRNIEHLDFSHTPMSPESIRALSSGEHVGGIKELRLCGTKLQNKGLKTLGQSQMMSSLEALDLSDTRIGLLGLETLQSAPWWGQIKRLNLSNNHLGRHGANVLGACLEESNVEQLRLSHCGLGLEGVLSLMAYTDLSVKHLDLRNNGLKDDAMIALASSPIMAHVESLKLGSNRLGDQSIRALLESPYNQSLQEIQLHWNPLSEDAKTWLDAHGIKHDVTADDWKRTIAGKQRP